MLLQKEIRDVINRIAVEYDVPYSVAEAICFSQFEFLANTIKSVEKGNLATYKNVRYRGLGTFHFSVRKVEYQKKAAAKKAKKDVERSDGELQQGEQLLED